MVLTAETIQCSLDVLSAGSIGRFDRLCAFQSQDELRMIGPANEKWTLSR